MSNSEGGKAARVESLWRYPVKSMQGAPHEELSLDAGGVAGDRAFGVLDVNTGTILSAKREGRLLEASASTATGDLVVTLPDGEELRRGVALDEGLSLWLGRPVRVVLAATFGAGTYAMPEDFERDDSNLVQWEGPVGSFVDESPLHLLTTGDLTQLSLERPDLHWDVRRFRPNVVIATALTSPELMAPGRHVQLGDCLLYTSPSPRDRTRSRMPSSA